MILLNRYNHILLLLAGVLVTAISCTKTEYEKIKQPYNDILHFEVAGYGDLAKVIGVVEAGKITVYWTGSGERPVTITPVIKVSDAATVSPASGTAVPFNAETRFTVTAEDGTQKVYQLNPVFNTAIPVLLDITDTRIGWVESKELNLVGQYFFGSGDTADIKVYGQRMSDGFEFDIPVKGVSVTPTSFKATLPVFSAALDSGMHKIWVKVKGELSGVKEVYFEQPWLRNTNPNFSLVENGQTIRPGQELTLDCNFTDNFNGNVSKYYKGKAKNLVLIFRNSANQNANITITEFASTDTQIKFRLPADMTNLLGRYLVQINVRFPQPLKDQPDYMSQATYYTLNTNTLLQAAQ